MARKITDAQRQVIVGLPERRVHWKRLMTWIVLACVVAGLSVGGYYVYNQATSTVEIPKPQVPPSVITPATPSETPVPTQSESQMPVLEVAWKKIELPPLRYGYDGIGGLLVENGGDTISVYRVMGPANDGEATLYSHWRTVDDGKTWNEVEELIIYPDQEKQLGFVPRERSWGGDPRNPYLSAGEIITGMPDPLTDFGNPYSVSKDPNNPDNILLISSHPPSDGSTFRHGDLLYRLFLSLDGRWYQVNFPPSYASYDAYPETPQLTLLKAILPSISIRIISTVNGSVKFFVTAEAGVFWKATANLKSPN